MRPVDHYTEACAYARTARISNDLVAVEIAIGLGQLHAKLAEIGLAAEVQLDGSMYSATKDRPDWLAALGRTETTRP